MMFVFKREEELDNWIKRAVGSRILFFFFSFHIPKFRSETLLQCCQKSYVHYLSPINNLFW